MHPFVMLLLLILGATLFIRWYSKEPPGPRKRFATTALITLLVLLLLMLVASGRLHWLAAVIASLIPLLRRSLSLLRFVPLLRGLGATWQRARSTAGPSTGKTSWVHTETLKMSLDHDSGDMDGEVLRGPFRGRNLTALSRDELTILYEDCLREDGDAARLLAAFMSRRFGDTWETSGSQGRERASGTGNDMTADEARQVLGLDETADEAAIIDAHRRLMQKLHPDRGGSDYLAAKINQAKDLLLG
jgi:hypothetical protein